MDCIVVVCCNVDRYQIICQIIIFIAQMSGKMPNQKEILTTLYRSVVEYQVEECRAAAEKVLEYAIDPTHAVMEGLAKGMDKVGVLYDTNVYFVPEVLMCADALYAGLDVLKPHMKVQPENEKATIIMGTVQGDVHDIGKNLVKAMFDTAGWKVIDLGSDVPLETFVEKQLEFKADILALSAMMTTTMMGMKKVISMIRAEQQECLVMIGGAPVTRDIADLFGADGYAPSAGMAVSEGLRMIARNGKIPRPNYGNG
jgi:corrinoid protein of di/trimethylamine methyltransferase